MSHALIKTQSRMPGALLSLTGVCDLGLIQVQGGVLLSILLRPPLAATRRRIERRAWPHPARGGLKKVRVEPGRSGGAETVTVAT
jgi:hypothetical protein